MKDKDERTEQLTKEIKELKQKISEYKLFIGEIEKSYEKVNFLLDAIPYYMILISDLDFSIYALNEHMAKNLGKTKEQLIGKNLFDVLPHNVAKFRRKQGEKAIKSGKPLIFDDEREGRWYRTEVYPVFNKSGKTVYGACLIHDITDKKKIDYSLKEKDETYHNLANRYRFIADNVADMILQVTTSGKITYITPNCETIAGYKQEEVIGRRFTQFAPKKEWPKYFSNIRKMLSGKKVPSFETCIIHKDGHIVPVDFSGQMVSMDKKSYFHAVMRDISERKKNEEAIRKSEAKTETILNAIPDLLFMLNKDGVFTSYHGLTGDLYLPPEKFIGKKVVDVLPSAVAVKTMKYLERALVSKQVQVFNYRLTVKNELRWYEARMLASGYSEVLSIVRDITDSKKAENELKESERKFRTLFENAPYGIYLHNDKGVFIDGNREAEKLIGYRKEELIGKNFLNLNLIPKEMLKKLDPGRHKSKESPPFRSIETPLFRKDGSEILVELNSNPIRIHNKLVSIGFARNITAERKAQSELIRAKEYLQNVIDGASEFMLVVDMNYKVSTWNKTAERLTGYKKREVLRRSINSLDVFLNSKDLQDDIKNIQNGVKIPFNELILRSKTGAKKLVRTSGSIVIESGANQTGVLFVGKEITQDSEMRGKLLQGNSYLIVDKSSTSALNLLVDLAVSGSDGLFITRGNPNVIQSMFQAVDAKVIMFSRDRYEGVENVSSLGELTAKIKEFVAKKSKPVVLIDRVDYLLTNFSFEAFVKSLYEINNIISTHNAILLMRVNSDILNASQLAFIEEELKPLPSQRIDAVELDDQVYGVLTFIDKQNKNNVLVSFKKISQEFSISKVTTAKRLNMLDDRGLIFIKKQGKSKTVHISDKGKLLLSGREAV